MKTQKTRTIILAAIFTIVSIAFLGMATYDIFTNGDNRIFRIICMVLSFVMFMISYSLFATLDDKLEDHQFDM